MYKIILTNATNDNQKVVWDVKQDIKLLRSASMQKQEDGIDSVSISPVHNFVENSATFIQPYNTLIEIINEKTNVIEFKGRVLSPESEMTDSGLFTHELIFEGTEAYLKDSIQSYSFEFDKMPVENLKKVIAHHNNELKSEAYKHFKVGNVTVEKNIIPSDENYNEELKYFKRSDDKDTYETLMDLKEKYGGTFIFEPTNDVTLVHWLKETGNLTNTVIKIGKNLKSIQKKFDASEVITRLKPLGASSETANGDEIKLTIAEVNNGSPYIDIPQLIKLFGIQTGTVTFDDKHTPETLKKAAEDWIKEHEKKQARISLSLDALDLSYLKLDPDEFKIYNKHRVICPPLNIDEDLKIISIKVDLLKPYDKEVSFGERELGYAELEKERSIKNTNLIINKTVPGIINTQTGGINRDVMVFNDYKITFEDLKLHQSNLLDEVNQILNSEYLVDDEVRADLLLKAQNVESLSNTIKDALESADERTINATKLVGLQNKMNAYRLALKSFVIAKEGAKISLLKRLQILQSQYTEKKFSDTLKSVAEKFGLTVNQYNELIGEPNVVQKAISVVTEQTDSKLANYVKSEDYQTDKNGIVERLNNSDSERQQLSNQIADRVTLTEYRNMKVGTRNLLLNSKLRSDGLGTPKYRYVKYQLTEPLVKGQVYTISFMNKITKGDNRGKTSIMGYLTNTTRHTINVNNNEITKFTFTADAVSTYFLIYTAVAGTEDNDITDVEITNAMLVKGSVIGDYQEAPEDADQKLATMKTEVIQDGRKYSQEVSQQVYNASSKTLNQTLSQYINSISTGHQFTYDENGNITSFTVGPNGIKLNAKVIDMNDGDVIIKNGVTTISDAYIPKLFSKQATIEYLKARDIDLNKATVSGSSNDETTVLSGGKIRSTGTFTRTFPQGSATYESYTESWNGTYRSGLISKSSGGKTQTGITRWLSLNDKAVTTQREIHSASPDKNGARFIDFFAEETYTSDVTGQGMHIYSGQALKIESEYGLYLNANQRFYIRTEDSGLEINKNGQNLVLKRTSPYTSTVGSGGSYMSIQSSDGVEQGNVGILSNNRNMSVKASYGEIHLRGSMTKVFDSDSENFASITAKDFVKASSRELKTNIKTLRGGLETIHLLTPVSYDYKNDLANGIVDGDIGFIAEDSPSISMMGGKAISVQKIATWSVLGLKELDNKVEKKFKEYEEKIKLLEDKLNEQKS